MSKATGTFEVTPGNEDTFHGTDDGPKLTHATGTQRSPATPSETGGGLADVLSAEQTATFVGIQRIEASIAGRTGTFIMRGRGEPRRHGFEGDLDLVPGSGTDGLAGITGEGSFHAAGGRTVSYELEYRFD